MARVAAHSMQREGGKERKGESENENESKRERARGRERGGGRAGGREGGRGKAVPGRPGARITAGLHGLWLCEDGGASCSASLCASQS